MAVVSNPTAGFSPEVGTHLRLTEDLEELAKISARVRDLDGYPVYLPDSDFHRFLTSPAPAAAWVAQAGGRVVGHVALNHSTHPGAMAVVRDVGITGDVGVVARLLVDPIARRQGLGARLLAKARTEAVGQGRVPVLDVAASSTAAIPDQRLAGDRPVQVQGTGSGDRRRNRLRSTALRTAGGPAVDSDVPGLTASISADSFSALLQGVQPVTRSS